MKVIYKRLCALNDLVHDPTIYEKAEHRGFIKWLPPSKRGPHYKGPDDKPLVRKVKADDVLALKETFHHLVVDRRTRLPVNGRYTYRARCRCGAYRRLSAFEILERDRLEVGCGRLECSAMGVEKRVFYDALDALNLQLAQLLHCSMLDTGDGYKTWRLPHFYDEALGIRESARRYLRDRLTPAEEVSGTWWLRGPLDEIRMPDPPRFGSVHTTQLFPHGTITVFVEGGLRPLNNFCTDFECDPAQVLKLYLIADPVELIDLALDRART